MCVWGLLSCPVMSDHDMPDHDTHGHVVLPRCHVMSRPQARQVGGYTNGKEASQPTCVAGRLRNR